MYEEAAKKLKQNTKIMEQTFKKENLNIESFNVRDADDDGSCKFLIELTSESLEHDVEIKVNIYDENDDIYAVESSKLYVEDFSGYDTVEVYFSQGGTLEKVAWARIYVTKV